MHASTPNGTITLFDRIAQERAEIRAELSRLRRRLGVRPPAEIREIFDRLQARLREHRDAVEKTLHFTLLSEEESNSIHEQILLEQEYHHVGGLLAEELLAISPADPRWKAKLSLFIELLERQLARSTAFLRAWKRELGPEETRLLTLRFEKRKTGAVSIRAVP